MKLTESSVEYLPQEEGLQGIYKQIERCARTCYKSEDKITEDSAKGFVDRMIESHHTAMLEHGTVYLIERYETPDHPSMFEGNPYTKIIPSEIPGQTWYNTTTNLRVIIETFTNWKEAFGFDDTPVSLYSTEYHEKRYTFKFICSRAIANELVRHRKFSFAQESQRYCNYSKDKYGNEITFIKPFWLKGMSFDIEEKYLESLSQAEDNYLWFLHWLQPQQARDVLPNATKTELIMTGFASDYRYLLDLRLFGKTGQPHPDMIDLMEKLRYEALEAGIWHDIMKCPSRFK